MDSIQTKRKLKVLEKDALMGVWEFPANFYVVRVGDTTYAVNNATLPTGDYLDGLACFATETDAELYMALPNNKGLPGKVEPIDLESARLIAKSRPKLNSLILFRKGKIVDYHYVR